MNDMLNKAIVLVLNRNWQAVNVRTPQEAFCMMAMSYMRQLGESTLWVAVSRCAPNPILRRRIGQ